jgi:hypothetical protein
LAAPDCEPPPLGSSTSTTVSQNATRTKKNMTASRILGLFAGRRFREARARLLS